MTMMKSALNDRSNMNFPDEPQAIGTSSLAQAVVQLDWRVSRLIEELSLSERQIPTVRIILANAMAQRASRRNQESGDHGSMAKDRIEALLTDEQRVRFDALIVAGQLELPRA